jgi:hypothetical protein
MDSMSPSCRIHAVQHDDSPFSAIRSQSLADSQGWLHHFAKIAKVTHVFQFAFLATQWRLEVQLGNSGQIQF